MIRIYSINWKVNVAAGGTIENPTCQAVIAVGSKVNKNHFDLTPDEMSLLRQLTGCIETRLAIDVGKPLEMVEPATADAAGGA